jgi:hypothetical protein
MPLWGLQYFSILDEVNNYSKYIADVNFKSRVNLFSHSIELYLPGMGMVLKAGYWDHRSDTV